MFEKTTEIINNSKPSSFYYMLYFTERHTNGVWYNPYTSECGLVYHFEAKGNSQTFGFELPLNLEHANDVVEEWGGEPMEETGDEGARAEKWELHEITEEILDEFKNSIIEDEKKNDNLYTEDEYKDYLNGCEEDDEDPYKQPTENFIKSWTVAGLFSYFYYNGYKSNSISDESCCYEYKYKDYILIREGDRMFFGLDVSENLIDFEPRKDEENEGKYED